MANEIRARYNLVSGTLSGSLTNVATSMSAAGLANLGVIDSTNYAAITIENEIVWVTAHTAAATTATILRAQEGTTAAAHNAGVAWQHGPTAFDLGTDWTPYTPTLTQSGAVTKTLTYVKYQKTARLVDLSLRLTVTGTGTAAQPVLVGLPVTAAFGSGLCIGSAQLYDASANLVYRAIVRAESTTTVSLFGAASTVNAPLGQDGFTAALASGDIIDLAVAYEALS